MLRLLNVFSIVLEAWWPFSNQIKLSIETSRMDIIKSMLGVCCLKFRKEMFEEFLSNTVLDAFFYKMVGCFQ